MRLLKLGLAGLEGFILGGWLFHTSTAHGNVKAHITLVNETGSSVRTLLPSGSSIVSFSCVQETRSPATCFVLSAQGSRRDNSRGGPRSESRLMSGARKTR